MIFPPLLLIFPPRGAARACVHFSLLQSNKGNPDLSWEFSSQLFLKAQYKFFTYSICCLFVTVNGKSSPVKFCVSLKGAAGPRGQPVSISPLNPFPFAFTEFLHLLRPFLITFLLQGPPGQKGEKVISMGAWLKVRKGLGAA